MLSNVSSDGCRECSKRVFCALESACGLIVPKARFRRNEFIHRFILHFSLDKDGEAFMIQHPMGEKVSRVAGTWSGYLIRLVTSRSLPRDL